MRNLSDQMPRLNQTNQNMADQMTQINSRLERLEASTPARKPDAPIESKPELDTPNPRRLSQDPLYNPNPRRPDLDQMDQEDKILRSIKLEAHTFDGDFDLKLYVDWEKGMERYFEEEYIAEERKCKFAKLKLVRQARLY